MAPISIVPLAVAGEIETGADLAGLLLATLDAVPTTPAAFDVLVVAQKIISKAEGCTVDLNMVTPSPRAQELAAITRKDARLVEVILSESSDIIRAVPHVLIVRHRCGYVMANAGIDRSNVPSVDGEDRVLLLPQDADLSAAALRAEIKHRRGTDVGVVIADSFGRPWRLGVTHVALGAAGVPALIDRRGERDRHGRILEVTQIAFADAIASAAGLAMGEGAEGVPAAWVRGFRWAAPERPASALIRAAREDLFR